MQYLAWFSGVLNHIALQWSQDKIWHTGAHCLGKSAHCRKFPSTALAAFSSLIVSILPRVRLKAVLERSSVSEIHSGSVFLHTKGSPEDWTAYVEISFFSDKTKPLDCCVLPACDVCLALARSKPLTSGFTFFVVNCWSLTATSEKHFGLNFLEKPSLLWLSTDSCV